MDSFFFIAGTLPTVLKIQLTSLSTPPTRFLSHKRFSHKTLKKRERNKKRGTRLFLFVLNHTLFSFSSNTQPLIFTKLQNKTYFAGRPSPTAEELSSFRQRNRNPHRTFPTTTAHHQQPPSAATAKPLRLHLLPKSSPPPPPPTTTVTHTFHLPSPFKPSNLLHNHRRQNLLRREVQDPTSL